MSQPTSAYVSLVRVRFNECDPLGHVNNAVYLNYLEQVAIDHAASLGWTADALIAEAGAAFVARKHEITYRQPAFENDWLLVRTWPTEMRGARGIRAYDISRFHGDPAGWQDRRVPPNELIVPAKTDIVVQATTEWAFMNVTTGRPVRIPDVVTRDFMSDP